MKAGEHEYSWSRNLSPLGLAIAQMKWKQPSPESSSRLAKPSPSLAAAIFHIFPTRVLLLLLLLLSLLTLQIVACLSFLHSNDAADQCRPWLWFRCSKSLTPGVRLSLTLNSSLFSISRETPTCDSGRIYVYDLPPQFNEELLARCSSLLPWGSLCSALENNGVGLPLDLPSWLGTGFWYSTNQFSSEVIYHARMLLYPCRTLDPEVATAFFVPFYTGLDLGRYLFVESSPRQRDELSQQLLSWLKQQKYWKRNGGWDHFLVIGRITWDFRRTTDSGWGSSLFHNPELKNVTRLMIERSPWDDREMGVPYPTCFHPRADMDVKFWQRLVRTVNRDTLFGYAGAPRPQFANDFRETLMEQCKQSNSCRSIDCSNQRCEDPLPVMELFLESMFCLQPRGDSFTRRSIFDSLLAGCIPVFFWRRTAYLQYEWHLPADGSSYSVFISKKDIESGVRIEEVLRALPEKKVKQMRERLVEAIPRFAYAVPGSPLESFQDAFDVAAEGVLKRIKGQIPRLRV